MISADRTRSRRTTVAAIAVVATAGAVLLPAAASTAAPSGTPTATTAQSCSLVNSTITATSSTNTALTEAFSTYGNTGEGWTGGDSTYSLRLNDGREAWFFSDTFLGPVNPDLSRPETVPFLNNSIVVDTGGVLSTVTGGTPEDPSIIGKTDDGKWHWLGDPQLGKHGDVQIPLIQFEKFGPGGWDFRWTANRLATLDGTTLELESVTELPSSAGINWSAWTEAAGSKTLVYGIRDVDGVRSAFVARVTGNDGLAGHWKFWDGDSWSPNEADAVPVASYVSNEFSVSAFRDGYLLVTQDTTEAFSNRVVAQVSCSPTGPFQFAAELYRTTEGSIWGSYGNANVYTYNAHEHPELRTGDTLVVTHNVNSFEGDDLYGDVTIYRPRFTNVQLTVVP